MANGRNSRQRNTTTSLCSMKIHDIEPGIITFGSTRSPWSDKSLGFRRTPPHGAPHESGTSAMSAVSTDIPPVVMPAPSLPSCQAPDNGGPGKGALTAPIPGVVVEIRVRKGDTVSRGDTVAVIEAMKMENDILAETDGIVLEIKAAEGKAVLEGETILIIG